MLLCQLLVILLLIFPSDIFCLSSFKRMIPSKKYLRKIEGEKYAETDCHRKNAHRLGRPCPLVAEM